MNGISNGKKEWFARIAITLFTMAWKALHRLSSRSFSAKDHYYIMKLFRLFFKSYCVWISYPNPIVPHKLLHLKVNLCENNQQWFFRLRNRYDVKEMYLIAEGMKSAEVFIDVGSHIGVYGLTIAQAFPDKRVIAFEPLGNNFDSLQANIARNGITNCVAHQKAIANNVGSVRFYLNPIHDGGGSVIPPKVYKTGDIEIDSIRYQQRHPEFCPWMDVETVPLSEIISQKSVLKIDVEGAEKDVLCSGSEAIKAGLVEVMIVEVIQETVHDILQIMDDLDFDSFLLPECRRFVRGERLPWFVKNIICLRKNTRTHAKMCQEVYNNLKPNKTMQLSSNAGR